jgi:hypothetical protein
VSLRAQRGRNGCQARGGETGHRWWWTTGKGVLPAIGNGGRLMGGLPAIHIHLETDPPMSALDLRAITDPETRGRHLGFCLDAKAVVHGGAECAVCSQDTIPPPSRPVQVRAVPYLDAARA